MRLSSALFSSEDMTWATPKPLFDALNEEFRFTVDVAAADDTAKCSRYWTKENDSLSKSWADEVCWMNPPYGSEIRAFMVKARDEARDNGATVVCLVPARTDARWFQETVFGFGPGSFCASEVRFIAGRIAFGDARFPAPFPSCLIIFRPTPPHSGVPVMAQYIQPGKAATERDLFAQAYEDDMAA